MTQPAMHANATAAECRTYRAVGSVASELMTRIVWTFADRTRGGRRLDERVCSLRHEPVVYTVVAEVPRRLVEGPQVPASEVLSGCEEASRIGPKQSFFRLGAEEGRRGWKFIP